ncbi:MAG: MATE family efflux transporter [Clostridia bacterium]|nr:MATE family efflux transporter [Clostridia bacterium]
MAIPIALQNMLASSFSLVDTLMVSQLGDIPLSATGMAGQWSWLFGMVLFGISSGAAVFVSQYWGDKNIKGIHRTTGIAVSAGVILSLLFFLVALLFPEAVLSIFNKTPEIIDQGSLYLRFACFSYPAMALTNILGSILRSAEHPKLPMAVSGISAVLNVILNYILIFPAGLGVQGAAIATSISAWAGPVLIILLSVAQKNILFTPMKSFFAFNGKTVGEFFKKAMPVIINETMWGMGTVAYNIIFANMGHEEYAAITIVKTFENFAFCFFLGLCNACCVMVGKAIGSGEIREGIRESKRFMLIFPFISIIVGAAVILLRAPLVSVFNLGSNISAYTIETAQWILVIYSVWIIVRNIPYLTVVGIFRPGGDTIMGMVVELAVLWCFSVPMTYIAANVWQLPFLTVYAIMYLCEDLPKGILFLWYWRSGKWIRPVTDAGRKGLEEFKS